MACRLFSSMGYGVGVGQGHSNNPRVVVSVLPIRSLPSHTLPRTPHLHHLSLPLFPRVLQRGAKHLASPVQSLVEVEEEEYVPTPVVIIDQDSDPEATIVEMSYGDRLGALLDTMKTLQNMGLNVMRGRISIEGGTTWKRFAITRTDTGRKIEDPMLLEAIRLAIISNMLVYHPESSAKLAMGNIFGTKPSKKLDIDIATHIRIRDDGPERSLLLIETADEPGLLGEIVKIITDVNVNFDSGEFDTEGLVAKSKFHVNYAGAALSKSLQEVLINSLRYYLRRPQTNDESY